MAGQWQSQRSLSATKERALFSFTDSRREVEWHSWTHISRYQSKIWISWFFPQCILDVTLVVDTREGRIRSSVNLFRSPRSKKPSEFLLSGKRFQGCLMKSGFYIIQLTLSYLEAAKTHMHIHMRAYTYKYTNKCVHVCVCAQPLRSCLTLCDPLDCNPPGSSVCGLLQWAAMPFAKGSSQPRDRTHISCVSCIAGRFFTHWATWEARVLAYTHTHMHVHILP